MKFAEFITADGPIYINADHVVYVASDPEDKRQTSIFLTHQTRPDRGSPEPCAVVRHTAIDVVLRLYKGME